MVNLFADEIVEALDQQGCALCRVLDRAEQWEMTCFLREGFRAPDARLRFIAGDGFCRRHGWLFHRLSEDRQTGFPIADLYRLLLDRDLELLGKFEAKVARKRRRGLRAGFRAAACPACEWADAHLHRKAAFFLEALASPAVRSRYSTSDGLCSPHFHAVLKKTPDANSKLAQFLVRDWRQRLERLARSLDEFDRKRDHRFAKEPRGSEQAAWIDAIRRYAGEPSSNPMPT
jgi:hypothetical protein